MSNLTNNDKSENTNDEPNIIRIPKWKLNQLEEKITKLNKKAAKIGCPPLSYKILEEKLIVDPAYVDPDNRWVDREERLPHIVILYVEIIGEGPKIEGWKFLGTFDHITLPGSVIVNTVPGETIPAKYHNCEPVCDHCGKKRRRNETFLLQEEETGDYKLIGRQCVRDFIGYDARQVFNYLQWIRKLEEDFDEDDFGSMGHEPARYYVFNADEILAVTASIIHKYGWISRSKADFDEQATADAVLHFFLPPKFGTKQYAMWREWADDLDADNEKWKKEASAARAWLKEQNDTNEYMHNLHAIDASQANEVPTRLFGYWCSLIATYQRAMETLREKENLKRVNEHVGVPKQRRDFNVNLRSVHAYNSDYGTTYKHTFLDKEGHTLIWWASREQDFEVGTDYTIKATVRKHDKYNNWAQTIINRVKEVTA